MLVLALLLLLLLWVAVPLGALGVALAPVLPPLLLLLLLPPPQLLLQWTAMTMQGRL